MIKKLLSFLTSILLLASVASADVRPGFGQITFVGVASNTVTNGAALTLTLMSGLVQGDFVVVCQSNQGIEESDGPQSNGWARVQIGASGVNYEFSVATNGASGNCWVKFMSSTPDTSIVFGDVQGTDEGMAAVAFAFRGVDAAAFDATTVLANGTSTTPDSPSITTVSPGAVIISAVISDGNDGTVTGPTDWNNATAVAYDETTSDNAVGMAWVAQNVTGATNPPAWAGFATRDWVAVTMALKPRFFGGPSAHIVLTGSPVTSASSNASGTYTFASTPLGNDAPNRATIVACATTDDATSFSTSSITLGGNAMTQVVTSATSGEETVAAIYIINSAGFGTSASLVVDYSEAIAAAGGAGAGCAVWAAYGLSSLTAVDTDFDFNTDFTAFNATAGGVAVAYAMNLSFAGGGDETCLWAGDSTDVQSELNTEVLDETVDSADAIHSAASMDVPISWVANATRGNVYAVCSSFDYTLTVAASFR